MLDLLFLRLTCLCLIFGGLLAGCSSMHSTDCIYSLSKDGAIYENCPGTPARFLRYMAADEDYIELAEDLGMNGYVVPAQ